MFENKSVYADATRHYIKPCITAVEFKVENGFGGSNLITGQNITNLTSYTQTNDHGMQQFSRSTSRTSGFFGEN